MVSITSLWMPVVLSAVIVFIVSSVIHMMLGYHASDYVRLPNEDAARAAIRALNIPPGDYHVPRPANSSDYKSPAYTAKLQEGPVGMMTILPNGPISMGASLVQWFVYSIVVSTFAAYVATRAVGTAGTYLDVFRFVGVTAFAGYSLALFQDSIWFKRSWTTTVKFAFDGLVYAVLTAGVFGWLWPQ